MIKFFKVLKFFVANAIWSSKTLTMWERRARESKTFSKENPKHSLEMQEKKPSQEIENLFIFLILF